MSSQTQQQAREAVEAMEAVEMQRKAGGIETLDQAVALFEGVGMPARNLAARTRTEYANDLRDLGSFLADRGIARVADVSLPHLEAYMAELDHRGHKPATRNRKTHTIKTFFSFLERQGLIPNNPALKLIPPRNLKREPRFLTEEEYTRLLRACSHNVRDAAIIEVYLQTGMRLSELVNLKVVDLELPARISRDPDNTGQAHIRRKGGKLVTIPLNYKACQVLASWLKARPKVEQPEVFISKFKTALSARAVQYVVAHYLHEAGITGASVHTLRHTMATHHTARGTDLKTLQETLGHASLATTSIYVQLAKKAQKRALQEHAL
jgi:site-specific recombinase XerD